MLAHELRNPLGALATALSVLEERGAPDGQTTRLRAVCRRQLDHLVRLVDDLLDVSRITCGKVELKPLELDLVATVENAATAVRPHFEARGQQLTVSLPMHPVQGVFDPTRVEQVVANLLSNAAKYTPPGGHVALDLVHQPGTDGGVASLHVADDGAGIRPEMLGKIFDLFVQGEPSPGMGKAAGLGVGLTLVKGLVEMHGGTVEARSAGPGKGALFAVRLPLNRLRASPSEPREVPEPSARSLSLLVIEDHDDVREALTSLLREWGHQVEAVPEGRVGIARAAAGKPDLVFVDIGLPDLDGYEVAKRMRLDPATANLSLVALTGFGRPEDRAKALRSGFDLHLVKPVDPLRLRTLLAHGVEWSHGGDQSRAGTASR